MKISRLNINLPTCEYSIANTLFLLAQCNIGGEYDDRSFVIDIIIPYSPGES